MLFTSNFILSKSNNVNWALLVYLFIWNYFLRFFSMLFLMYFSKNVFGHGQCGSVGWASSHKVRGHGFNSQSWPLPRLQACPRSRQQIDVFSIMSCFPPFISPSLPVSLKIHLKKCFYIELYTWNLYNFINHCHPQKRQVGKKRKINKNFFISIYSQNCIYHFSLNTKDQNVVRWLHVSARQAKQCCLLTRCSCAHRKCWQGRRAVRMDTGAWWTQLTTVLITYNTWLLCHK